MEKKILFYGVVLITLILSISAAFAEEKKLEITSPVGGEMWYWDNTYKISWTADNSIKNVIIYVYNEESDKGSGYINYITPNGEPISAKSGFYSWSIKENSLPAYDGDPALHEYYIRIDGLDDSGKIISSISSSKPLFIQSPVYQAQNSDTGVTYENEDGTPLTNEQKKQLTEDLNKKANSQEAKIACKNSEVYSTAPLKHKEGGYLIPSLAGGCLDKDFGVVENFNKMSADLLELEKNIQKNISGEALKLATENIIKIKEDLVELQIKIENLKTNEEVGTLEPEVDRIYNVYWAVFELNNVANGETTNTEWADRLKKAIIEYKEDVKKIRSKISLDSGYNKKLDQFDAVLNESAALIDEDKIFEASIKLGSVSRIIQAIRSLTSGGLLVSFNPVYFEDFRNNSSAVSVSDDLEIISFVLNDEGNSAESIKLKEESAKLQLIIPEQKNLEKRIEESKNKAKERSPIKKFIIGTDKKSLEVIKNDSIKIKQNAKKINKISEELNDGEDIVQSRGSVAAKMMSDSANRMEQENRKNESFVSEQEAGFSLLGWAF